ncbi:hypothetical protein ILUMI_06254 [Ignelater luminosus]|uniref:Pacifastin domain-containing protein n=1 Tax=Ignelater luminosus TaxID=2038154 RepID=A0A8K0DAN6_IGNLU|nr:hypothetical protein ILUMI_06254 [Ignelater luminosus]
MTYLHFLMEILCLYEIKDNLQQIRKHVLLQKLWNSKILILVIAKIVYKIALKKVQLNELLIKFLYLEMNYLVVRNNTSLSLVLITKSNIDFVCDSELSPTLINQKRKDVCTYFLNIVYFSHSHRAKSFLKYEHFLDTPLPPLPSDGTCVSGNSYQQDCNVCRCLADGKLACTDKLCPSKAKRSADPQQCATGDSKQEGCNNCRCTNGVWSCTRRACLGKRAADECTIGDTKKENCNDCKCTQLGDGRAGWVCTRRACPENFPGRSRRAAEVCTEGTTKEIECNNCRCLKLGDGSTDWACTKRACPSERSRRDA